MRLMVLLTDFGFTEYVGVMKGQIYRNVPDEMRRELQIIDLVHDILPQNIKSAAWVLLQSYRYFPSRTIFCCVVDPGVGTTRKIIAAKSGDYWFVAPDNGLLWPILETDNEYEVWEIPIPSHASKTFHGRDVMAVAAANLVYSLPESLGWRMTKVRVKMSFHLDERKNEGEIVHIDHFGNIITNIPAKDDVKSEYEVEIDDWHDILHFHHTYADADPNELFLIKGSANTFEISVSNGSAVSRKPNLFIIGKKIKIH